VACSEGEVSSTIDVTIAGVTGIDAADWNTTHTIDWSPGTYDCQWYKSFTGSGSGQTLQIIVGVYLTTFPDEFNIICQCIDNGVYNGFLSTAAGTSGTCVWTSKNLPKIYNNDPTFAAATVAVTSTAC
jgi:hypothetical protein